MDPISKKRTSSMRTFSGSRNENGGRIKKPLKFLLPLSASYELHLKDTRTEVFAHNRKKCGAV
jgi:hypothetical protein